MINSLPELAQSSLQHTLTDPDHSLFNPTHFSEALQPFLNRRAGAFVTLKQHGQLRGCIGTIQPVQPHLIQEVIVNSVSAGLRDPRFPPVQRQELPTLQFSVSVLHPPEPIESTSQLDPHRYGVIVSTPHKRGLLLPQLEGINTVEEQLFYARQKAGIFSDESVHLERFLVDFYDK